MGRAKEAMLAAEEAVWSEGGCTFTCPECGKVSDGYCDLPCIRRIDPEDETIPVEVDCIWCNEKFSGDFIVRSGVASVEFDDYPELTVCVDPPLFQEHDDYDEWLADEYLLWISSDEPWPVFERTYADIDNLLRAHGSAKGDAAINKMIYGHCFSMYEAFLGDTFVRFVCSSAENQDRFIADSSPARGVKITLGDLQKHRTQSVDTLVKLQITQIITSVSFHNLERVIALYRIFGIDIFENDAARELLFEAVKHRHDCVHRNGYSRDGKRLDVYTADYVHKVAEQMAHSASFVNRQIAELRGAGAF